MIYLYEGLSPAQPAQATTPAFAAKTVWSTTPSIFAGGRRLIDEVGNIEGLPLERALYSATGNAPNWCNFQGVTCGFSSAADGSVSGNSYVVTKIDISNLGLIGFLPSNIGNMKFLQTLLVNSNKLTGTIPTTIGAAYLTFKTLQLDSNQFSGTIPTQIGSLTELTTLTLNSNLLTGTIPTQMSQMTLLTSFKAQDNTFIGDPPSFKQVSNSKFSALLRNTAGGLNLDGNCLIYAAGDNSGYSALVATGCKPTGQPSMRKFFADSFKRYLYCSLSLSNLI
jgi:hypothetical protein